MKGSVNMKNLKLNILSDTFYQSPSARNLLEFLEKYDESLENSVLYYEYPIIREIDEDLYFPTFMLVSPKFGINLFMTDSLSIDRGDDIDELTERILRIEQIIFSRLIKSVSKGLLKGRRNLVFNLSSALFLPNFNKDSSGGRDSDVDIICNTLDLGNYLDENVSNTLDGEAMKEIFSILDSSSGIIKPKERAISQDISKRNTKSDILKKLEEEISVFDSEQQFAALSQLNGPQRIRGLAGSGKTIILCMKAALLHLKYPDKKILYTFMTKSLYDYIETLITRFYKMLGDGYIPDFKDSIHIRHSWGGDSISGVYYEVCQRNEVAPVSFSVAMKNVGRGNAFDFVCKNLLQNTGGNLIKEYDYVLIDEGQDFQPSFYQLCRAIVKNDCLVWAYDDLQNIYNVEIQDTIGTFKNEYGAEGIDLSELQRDFPDMDNDIVLHRCYRNPKEILVVAHALGFGIYNDVLIQTLENKEHWKDVGYEVISGDIVNEQPVIIERPDYNSPLSISTYCAASEIIQYYSAKDSNEEIDWVVEQVKNAIRVEGLRPDDIIIISLDDMYSKKYFEYISEKLYEENIYTNNLSSNSYYKGFSEEGKVTLSTVYKAKGHESAMVFVIGCDVFESRKNILNMRNRVFTAFTRAKAWLRISGIDISEKSLVTEINKVVENNYQLNFVHKAAHIIKRDLQSDVKKVQAREKFSDVFHELKKQGYTDNDLRDIINEYSRSYDKYE